MGSEIDYQFPREQQKTYLLRDALKKGELYGCNVPLSEGQSYSCQKKLVLAQVPPGGCYAGGIWRQKFRRLIWEPPIIQQGDGLG
jgi:hypothetical protein